MQTGREQILSTPLGLALEKRELWGAVGRGEAAPRAQGGSYHQRLKHPDCRAKGVPRLSSHSPALVGAGQGKARASGAPSRLSRPPPIPG